MERATGRQSADLAPLLLERDSELETAAHALRRPATALAALS